MHCSECVTHMSVHISVLPKLLPSPLEISIQHRFTSLRINLGCAQTPLLHLAHPSCKAVTDLLPTGMARFTRVIDVKDF